MSTANFPTELNDLGGDVLEFLPVSMTKIPDFAGDPLIVANWKIKLAFVLIRQPCIIEVEGLEINALNGMPGLAINNYINKLGLDGIIDLLE